MMTDIKRVTQIDDVECGAIFSACEKYRYVLWRVWDTSKPLWMFVLLNPSKATEQETDPTITRQIERAKRGGAGGIVVVNSGAIRETDSDVAVADADPIGAHNIFWIKEMIPLCDVHIAGWGPKASVFQGDRIVKSIFREENVSLKALKINKDGSPRHPLYIPYEAPLLEYELN